MKGCDDLESYGSVKVNFLPRRLWKRVVIIAAKARGAYPVPGGGRYTVHARHLSAFWDCWWGMGFITARGHKQAIILASLEI